MQLMFCDWLSDRISNKGYSKYKVCKMLDVKSNPYSVYCYCDGKKIPSDKTLEKLFDILEVEDSEREEVKCLIEMDRAVKKYETAKEQLAKLGIFV